MALTTTDNCTPRNIQVDASTGCTLTRASITGFTSADIEAQGFKEVGLVDILRSAKEARMTGVPENALYDLLLSRMKPKAQGKAQSIIQPFNLYPQESVVNANYFTITAGVATPGAGAGGVHPGAWDATVGIGSGTFQTSLTNLEGYFLKEHDVVVQNKNTTTGNRRVLQFKIYASVNADSGATSLAKVTLVPNVSAAEWASMTSDEKDAFKPESGVLQIMGNSISDFESWKRQFPSVNSRKFKTVWHQTFRHAFSYSDEYLKALEASTTSLYFKDFRQLPMAKQRKQQELLFERAVMNSFFYGDQINENQTETLWRNLPTVEDPANAGCTLEFKANLLGLHTQLNRCGKVSDMQGAALNLATIFELCYTLKRYRSATGGSVDTIDLMTNRFVASRIHEVMLRYYKAKYGAEITMFFAPNQKIEFNGQKVLEYTMYELPEQGVQMAVITNEFFNDKLSAFTGANQTVGNEIWMLDWSDVDLQVLKTNSAKRRTNEADHLYEGVISVNNVHTMLNSRTLAVDLGDPNRHAMIVNFDHTQCPVLDFTACGLGNA